MLVIKYLYTRSLQDSCEFAHSRNSTIRYVSVGDGRFLLLFARRRRELFMSQSSLTGYIRKIF